MRDLNLGPDSKKLIEQFRALDSDQRTIERKADELYSYASQMAKMLERWLDLAWCWTDACPAQVCKGPHFRVKYQHDRMVTSHNPIEVIEQAQHVGETFPDVPYTIVR
jgi:hypothetical protein